MLNRLSFILFSIGIVFSTYGKCAQQDLGVIEPRSCSPESFDEGSCTISCAVNETSTLNSWSWQYFTTYETTCITIYDGVQLRRTGYYIYTSSLTLDDYNAGTYKCLFSFSNNPYLSAKIKIDTEGNGADLYDHCEEDHDCKALHATCTDDNHYHQKVCQCTGQYNITYSTIRDDTPSCLKLQPEGGHCNSQKECNWPTQNYSCVDSQCTCVGQKTEVETHGKYSLMCIQPAYLHDYCHYDEQCELTTEHSYCYHNGYGIGHCICESDYIILPDDGRPHSDRYCLKPRNNGWDFAIIVLGCLVALSLIGTTMYYILKKHDR